MSDERVSVHLDMPASLALQRLRALGRLLGVGVVFGAHTLALVPEAAAAERSPAWSLGEVRRPETVNFRDGRPVPEGLFCGSIFGDPLGDVRRYGHIPLADPVVPWAARPRLASLLDMTEEALLELCWRDPEDLLARVGGAEATGRRVDGLSPQQLVWWSIPVISPPLRAASTEEALTLLRNPASALHAPYRRLVLRTSRLRQLRELQAPDEIVENERRTTIDAVDELLANRERAEPIRDDDNAEPRTDATTLFFAALTPALVEAAESAPGGSRWIRRAADLREGSGPGPRMAALWQLAAERPAEPLGEEIMTVFIRSVLDSFPAPTRPAT